MRSGAFSSTHPCRRDIDVVIGIATRHRALAEHVGPSIPPKCFMPGAWASASVSHQPAEWQEDSTIASKNKRSRKSLRLTAEIRSSTV
jgi:hypothetical protein